MYFQRENLRALKFLSQRKERCARGGWGGEAAGSGGQGGGGGQVEAEEQLCLF